MAFVFRPDKEIIERTLETLKERGSHVAPDARFNHDAPDGLRREVCFRDEDFLNHLSSTQDERVVDSILLMLKEKGLVPAEASYRKDAYERFVTLTRNKWFFPFTTFTRVMRRLFFMLSSVRKPRVAAGIGIFYGYTLLWSAAPGCGKDRSYKAEKVYGIDINPEAIEGARKNFTTVEDSGHVELIAEDGLVFAERFEGQIDFLHLDADGKEKGKEIYLDLLKALYSKLSPGAFVLAHDVGDPGFIKRGVFDEYIAYVRDPEYFSESILFDIDNLGLELSIK